MSLQRLHVARDLAFTIAVTHGATTSHWVSAIIKGENWENQLPAMLWIAPDFGAIGQE